MVGSFTLGHGGIHCDPLHLCTTLQVVSSLDKVIRPSRSPKECMYTKKASFLLPAKSLTYSALLLVSGHSIYGLFHSGYRSRESHGDRSTLMAAGGGRGGGGGGPIGFTNIRKRHTFSVGPLMMAIYWLVKRLFPLHVQEIDLGEGGERQVGNARANIHLDGCFSSFVVLEI